MYLYIYEGDILYICLVSVACPKTHHQIKINAPTRRPDGRPLHNRTARQQHAYNRLLANKLNARQTGAKSFLCAHDFDWRLACEMRRRSVRSFRVDGFTTPPMLCRLLTALMPSHHAQNPRTQTDRKQLQMCTLALFTFRGLWCT